MIARLFRLADHATSPRTEIVGGITTFVTMAYIMIVNPAILAAAGIPIGPSTTATIVVAAAGSILMGLSLFFVPLLEPLQQLRYAYGPTLIAVGVLMMEPIRRIDFDDLTELVPAFATIAMMAFTYNIANGLTAGLVLHPLMKILAGRWREVTAGGAVLALLCLVYYVFGLPH